jgi:nitrogen fixation NifU-like protein
MFDDLNELYGELIRDHGRRPRNYRKMENANHLAQGHNPSCGDHYTVYLHTEGDVIKDISFDGDGCEISKASGSLLTTALKGKKTADVKALFERVREMITTGKADSPELGKLAAFAGVYKFPARVKCAILPWHAAVAAVEKPGGTVCTENDNT